MSLISTQARHFAFDRDTLHLLAQSPSVQFIYWQLSSSKQMLLQEHFQKDWRSLSPSLRFHEVVDPSPNTSCSNQQQPAGRVSELLLPPGDSCFLSGLASGQAYYARLGIRNEQGYFLPLLHSNIIQIPAISLDSDHHSVETDHSFIYQLTSLLLPQVTPDEHAYFSAYSVYVPKNTYLVDTESGGDTD
ncbi:hypothetical protein ASG89_20400 [Paenibacillus sp. Soil766]|uniref:DUF4912 domain-containing protein n=1 Tax=Paenibacillus sp. Soil766 TaxID=1736404 RepID=UPI0007099E46|nr:DUF4912 domain-containing protein [Paenibacillus sp. Soil766]KRF05491.1 hypothetical protein ASG89_20400 [Paenibacillus sp. Soil766]